MYYIYALIDPRTNLPFYIGKGKMGSNRHMDHFKESVDNTDNRHKVIRIRYLIDHGYTVEVRVLVEDIMDECDAYQIETGLIKKYGRINVDPGGVLVNVLLEGGRPPSWKGRTQTDEHIARRMNSRRTTVELYGLPPKSIEQRRKLSEKMSGDKNPFYGKRHSDDFKRQHSRRMKGNQSHAKWYEFIDPDGVRHNVCGFAEFCRLHKLPTSTLERAMNTGKWPVRGKSAGWRVERINNP